MSNMELGNAEVILDSLNDGLYVCDTERRIVYWNKSAERITGWTAEDVVGRKCLDKILCHVDKNKHSLCGEEFCPLHRCMVTNRASTSPLLVFGQTKAGGHVPMSVSVAPLHDEEGRVVGGIETFLDYTETYENMKRAQRIQTLSLEHDLPQDSRISFNSLYLPYDMIGGDYFAIRQVDDDHYGFFLADVMGHGVAAALQTMHLSALWSRYSRTIAHPAEFARLLNRNLCRIVKDESFATAICGILDASRKVVRIASAGAPPMVLVRADGQTREVSDPGLPFGMIESACYGEMEFSCESGDSLLIFTDGAVEVQNAKGSMLGTEGLLNILRAMGHPQSGINVEALQEGLLSYSNGIRLDDDLTLLEVKFS